jgi:hypothetical protein
MHQWHSPVRWQLTVLGILMCLLAALFAVEAKVAWFGPDGGPTAQISSTKLQPADAPKVATPIDAPSFPAAWLPEIAVILAFALNWRRMSVLPRQRWSCTIPGSPSFFPSVFFRPPPSI